MSDRFSFGADWLKDVGLPLDPELGDGQSFIEELSREAARNSSSFFGYQTPKEFRLNGNELSFPSAADSPISSNQTVRSYWRPAKGSRKAVVILPHWGANAGSYRALCRAISAAGISALELSLPYHGSRCPDGAVNGEPAISANIGRTIHAARQSVIDTRSCLDWLQLQGYDRLGMVGTSLGSGFGFLASAHDSRLRVNVFNHAGSKISDIIWHARQSRRVREQIEKSGIDLAGLNRLWRCVDPGSYFSRFGAMKKKCLIVFGLFDSTFKLGDSLKTISGLREKGASVWPLALPCGHASLGWPPFSYIDAGFICAFLRRNL